MLMSKNVDNDVSKDSPIDRRIEKANADFKYNSS